MGLSVLGSLGRSLWTPPSSKLPGPPAGWALEYSSGLQVKCSCTAYICFPRGLGSCGHCLAKLTLSCVPQGALTGSSPPTGALHPCLGKPGGSFQ